MCVVLSCPQQFSRKRQWEKKKRKWYEIANGIVLAGERGVVEETFVYVWVCILQREKKRDV